ncbi:MAG TPA: sigma-54 dependent transcriptional regulator [Bacteroidota bacterium]|nr:sigma-54 dependent transcriptional regulator [Bacteroidota bacterium]
MRPETIFILDDENLIRWSLKSKLAKAGYDTMESASIREAQSALTTREPDLIILDQNLPDGTGVGFLEELRAAGSQVPVVMLTAVDRSNIAVQAMKLGAADYITKPINFEELLVVIEKALETTRVMARLNRLQEEQRGKDGLSEMVGDSTALRKVHDFIRQVAQSKSTTILITGESGTGKELVARAIHSASNRRDKPLMTVNCSALTESLVESELFGHEKGAFTDAKNQKKGVFELADTGTIFLDEIGDVTPKMQVKLLRVLEQKTFQRVGGYTDITVDIRVIAATNRSLEELVEEGRFRTDLYYRLNVAQIVMPPIRERGEDILLIASHFLNSFNTKFHKSFNGMSDEVRRLFMEYPWPGNVRELRNVLERAVLLNDAEVLRPEHVELFRVRPAGDSSVAAPPGESLPLSDLERQALVNALEKSGNNQSRAAKILRITRDTLRYRMKKYGIHHH